MPVRNYGVWVATPISFTAQRAKDDPKSPHITLTFMNHLSFNRKFTAAINVKSLDKDSRLVYWLVEDLQQDFTNGLKELDPGFHLLEDGDPISLDYLRSGLLDINAGTILPHDIPGPDNDIVDKVSAVLTSSIQQKATIYIYGSQFPRRDGIHDVHMNQGSLPRFDNGIGQDGGLFFEFPDGHWEAIFLAFASQMVPTDDRGLAAPDAQALSDILGGDQSSRL